MVIDLWSVMMYHHAGIPALMAKGSVSCDAALEKTTLLCAILGKRFFFQPFTVFSTDTSIQGVLENVAGLVAHPLHFFLDVSWRVFEVLPGFLNCYPCVSQPGHTQGVLLHLSPVSDTLELVKTAGDKAWKFLTLDWIALLCQRTFVDTYACNYI